MFIDTHAHLNFKAYERDLDEVIARSLREDVYIINVGSKYKTSLKAVEIAERYKEGVYGAIGLHPIHSTPGLVKIRTDKDEGGFETEGEEFNEEDYKKLAESKKVVAIGEIGLDYYYKPKTTERKRLFKEKQKEIFIKQLNMAEELDLPVILHCRMAHQDLIEILESKIKNNKTGINGVIHCFTGSWSEAERYLNMGLCLGFNGIIFKLNLDEVIRKTPIEKILIETDCPYLSPPEIVHLRNEPVFVKSVAKRISEIKNISLEEVGKKTTENAKCLFKI